MAKNRELVIGADVGLTNMKAVAFDLAGKTHFSSSAPSPNSAPKPHWSERDGRSFWQSFAGMIRDLTEQVSDAGGFEIIGLGICAHGDGIWLVDQHGDAVRPGILSLDSRAQKLADRMNAEAEERILDLSGMNSWTGSPPTLLRWLKDNEPEALDAAKYCIAAADFLRGMLTGSIGTNLTDASNGLFDIAKQEYSDEILDIFGISDLRKKLPTPIRCYDVAGKVSLLASKTTGLREGLPVIAGCHDVNASAIGAGVIRGGQLAVMAGTWSINEVISDAPVLDKRWWTGAFVHKGQWKSESSSPAGSLNLEWFVKNLARVDAEVLERAGKSRFEFVDHEVRNHPVAKDYVTFLPYLSGNPLGVDASGSFSGLRAWHERGDLLRGLYEGLAFNHRQHCEALFEQFDVSNIRVVGGVAQSQEWPKIFAASIGRPVEISKVSEAGALGTAIMVAVAAGAFSDLQSAVSAMEAERRIVEPDPELVGAMEIHYQHYRDLVDGMRPWWGTA